jgi:probable F420-dependent oxidoreductase
MKVSLELPLAFTDGFIDRAAIGLLAKSIEAVGFYSCYVTDHPIPDVQWLRQGGHQSPDPFVALSFVAAATDTLRLQTNIVVLPYRNPFLTAKSAASLDYLSQGRLILGVGTGYSKKEFAALGVDFEERGTLMDEALQTIKIAWTESGLNVAGKHFSAVGHSLAPQPSQKPHPPIWVGGNSQRAIRRAVDFGDGWLPFPVSQKLSRHVGTAPLADLADLKKRIGYLHAYANSIGRDKPIDICMVPFGLDMYAEQRPSTEQIIGQFESLQTLGVSAVNIALPGDTLTAFLDNISAFGETVLRHFSEKEWAP